MSIVKSIAVGNGDMFYIKHNSDNFTMIDCCLSDDNKDQIVAELKRESRSKGIKRFISTHPDEDHISGLDFLDESLSIENFYCVKNSATKKDETNAFKRYCELRDSDKAFYISEGCSRKWMNQTSDERGSSGINILWPDTGNVYFKTELEQAADGGSPNNISPIIKYSLEDGVKMLWMGDLERNFMENIQDELNIHNIDILFAPHHGRDSGKIPSVWLEKMDPKIIIIGEAPSKNLNYYAGYNTITQNSAGDIIFDCVSNKVHIYVSNSAYQVDFLNDEKQNSYNYYLGTLDL